MRNVIKQLRESGLCPPPKKKTEPECRVNVLGDKFWCLNGKYHREDGPAIEYANGYKAWYLNGELHREEGPAVEHTNGNKAWCLNGINVKDNPPYIDEYFGDRGEAKGMFLLKMCGGG